MALTKGEEIGLGVAGGVAIGALAWALLRRPPQAAVVASPSTATVPAGTATSANTNPSGSGVTSYTPRPASGSRRANALPTTQAQAPSVGAIKLLSYSAGVAVVTWTGAPATWNGADNTGYSLFQRSAGGSWKVVGIEVEPPLDIKGLQPGDVIGVAPTYLTPGGREVAGKILTVNIP